MAALYSRYSRWLTTAPYLSRCATAGGLLSLADISCQAIQHYRENKPQPFSWNARRTFSMTIVGSCLVGPVAFTWMKALDRWVGSAMTFQAVTKKVALDMLCFSPPMTAAIMVLATTVKDSPEAVPRRLRTSFPSTLMTAYCYWPGIQFVNFYYVAPKWRMLVFSCASFVWNLFLSSVLNSPTLPDKEQEVHFSVTESSIPDKEPKVQLTVA